jgi:hypothetical protein
MRVLWGLLKAICTDLTGGYRQRKFKNPAEEIPIWRMGQDARDEAALLQTARAQREFSETQEQEVLQGEDASEAFTLHSFPPSKDELAKLRPGQEEDEELVQKGYEEVVESPAENEGSKTETSNYPELPEMPSTSLESSLACEPDSEGCEAEDPAETDSFNEDIEADLDSGGFDSGAYDSS